MALLKKYESRTDLPDFKLGYYNFFKAFTVVKNTAENRFQYTWYSHILCEGRYQVKVNKPKEETPLGGYVDLAAAVRNFDVNQMYKELDELEFIYNAEYPYSQNANFINDLIEFSWQQTEWIKKPGTIKYGSTLKIECQRRINFFLDELQKHFAGKAKEMNSVFRDIRDWADLCMKE